MVTGDRGLPAAVLAANAKEVPSCGFIVAVRCATGRWHSNGDSRAGTGFEPVFHGAVVMAVQHQLAAFVFQDGQQFGGISQRLAW